MNWRRWDWMDNGVMPLALAILRLCWLWLWIALFQRWLASSYQGMLLPVGMAFGLLLGGAAAARWALNISRVRARAAVAVLGLITIFVALWWQLYRPQYALWDLHWLRVWGVDMTQWADWEIKGVPPAFFALLAMAGLWLVGILDGGRLSLDREQVWRVFSAGFLALVFFLMVANLGEQDLPQGAASLLWLYFGTGMVALALTGLRATGGLERALEPAGVVSDAEPRIDRYWLGSVVTVIGLLLVIGMGISALVAPEAVAQVLGAVWAVIRQGIIFLWIAISLLLLPLAYLIAKLLMPLFGALQRAAESMDLEGVLAPRDFEALKPEELSEGGNGLFGALPPELKWVMLGLAILLIGLAFAAALRRLVSGSRMRDGIEETHELILSRQLLQEQLARLWQSWLDGLRRQSKAAISPFLSLEDEGHNRRRIRAVYQELLATAQELGRPRLRNQTPGEYAHQLEQSWSNSRERLSAITEGYVQARYALELPSAEQARNVCEAWEELQLSLEVDEDQDA